MEVEDEAEEEWPNTRVYELKRIGPFWRLFRTGEVYMLEPPHSLHLSRKRAVKLGERWVEYAF